MRTAVVLTALALGCSAPGVAVRPLAEAPRQPIEPPRSAATEPAHDAPSDDVAVAFLRELTSHAFARAAGRFDPAMAHVLPAERLESAWMAVEGRAGKPLGCRVLDSVRRPSAEHTWFACELESANWHVEVAVDPNRNVSGLRLMPAPAPWTVPSYADPGSFAERPVEIGRPALAGTIAVPARPNGAVVVLVHGSGPQDQDASSGPGGTGSKVFKDLAWGLATQGIAVIRYPKRSWSYPEQFENTAFTLDDEVTLDACDAVAKAGAALPGARVFLAGHSLGAAMAPRIASECPAVKGMVLMAGPSRRLMHVLFDQFNYLLPLAGQERADVALGLGELITGFAVASLPTNDASEEMVFSGMRGPKSYWADVDTYDPVAAMAVAPRIPVLVLQGARDYQVTLEDFGGWKRSFGGETRATFRLYPLLDHRFVQGQGAPSPADYHRGGNVAPQVVRDIAAWVTRAGPVTSIR